MVVSFSRFVSVIFMVCFCEGIKKRKKERKIKKNKKKKESKVDTVTLCESTQKKIRRKTKKKRKRGTKCSPLCPGGRDEKEGCAEGYDPGVTCLGILPPGSRASPQTNSGL